MFINKYYLEEYQKFLKDEVGIMPNNSEFKDKLN